jgi:hypothetical protein
VLAFGEQDFHEWGNIGAEFLKRSSTLFDGFFDKA